jgi:hypothetical protein
MQCLFVITSRSFPIIRRFGSFAEISPVVIATGFTMQKIDKKRPRGFERTQTPPLGSAGKVKRHQPRPKASVRKLGKGIEITIGQPAIISIMPNDTKQCFFPSAAKSAAATKFALVVNSGLPKWPEKALDKSWWYYA